MTATPAGTDRTPPPSVIRIFLTVFLPFAGGYFLSYLYRNVNAVISTDLASSFGLEEGELGLLTAAYFLSFAAFQLPLGILLDRYGPRRVEVLLLLVAALGAFWFSRADSLAGLTLARGLIGLGVSACLMAAFKANVLWWPADRLAFVNSAFVASGGLGALAATRPVAELLVFLDWRDLFCGLAVLTLVAAAAIAFLVPEHPDGQRKSSPGEAIQGVRSILGSRLFWLVAPASFLTQALYLAYQGLWAGSWLKEVEGMSAAEASGGLFLMAIAMTTGYVATGWIADQASRRFGIRNITVFLAFVLVTLGLELLLVISAISGSGLPDLPVWILFSFCGTASMLSYAILSRAFPDHLAGRVNTTLNLMVFVSAFLLQYGLGLIIESVSALFADSHGGTPGLVHGIALASGLTLQALTLLRMLASWKSLRYLLTPAPLAPPMISKPTAPESLCGCRR